MKQEVRTRPMTSYTVWMTEDGKEFLSQDVAETYETAQKAEMRMRQMRRWVDLGIVSTSVELCYVMTPHDYHLAGEFTIPGRRHRLRIPDPDLPTNVTIPGIFVRGENEDNHTVRLVPLDRWLTQMQQGLKMVQDVATDMITEGDVTKGDLP